MDNSIIVLGVIGSDCHSVGNKVLDSFFSERGYKVVNLGVMVSQKEFIDAAIEHDAAVIMVSSLYGHAEIDCAGFREHCRECGLDDILLYIGGNLVVGKSTREVVQRKFTECGFDRVFLPGDSLEDVAEILKADLDQRACRAKPERPARGKHSKRVRQGS